MQGGDFLLQDPDPVLRICKMLTIVVDHYKFCCPIRPSIKWALHQERMYKLGVLRIVVAICGGTCYSVSWLVRGTTGKGK